MARIPVNWPGAISGSERLVDFPIAEWVFLPEKYALLPADIKEALKNVEIGKFLGRSLSGSVDNPRVDPRITAVSMGNPHVVLYCEEVADVPLESVGPHLETLPIFPNRINVHFVQVHGPAEVTMRTWERGSGITLACGTRSERIRLRGRSADRANRKADSSPSAGWRPRIGMDRGR